MYPTLVVVIVTIRRSILEYTLNSSSLPVNIGIALGVVDGPTESGASDGTVIGPSESTADEKRVSKETHRTAVMSQVAHSRETV